MRWSGCFPFAVVADVVLAAESRVAPRVRLTACAPRRCIAYPGCAFSPLYTATVAAGLLTLLVCGAEQTYDF